MAQPEADDAIESPFEQLYSAESEVSGEKKCGGCGYFYVQRFIFATGESHAEAKREEMAHDTDQNGLCGGCVAEIIMNSDYRIIDGGDQRPFASGVSLPAIGNAMNGDVPPAGEPYSHENFRQGMESCSECGGDIVRVKVVSDRGNGDEPAIEIETIEASCRNCNLVLYKNESVVYDCEST